MYLPLDKHHTTTFIIFQWFCFNTFEYVSLLANIIDVIGGDKLRAPVFMTCCVAVRVYLQAKIFFNQNKSK